MNSDYHRWFKKRDDFGVPVTLQFDTWKNYNPYLQKIQMSQWNTGVFYFAFEDAVFPASPFLLYNIPYSHYRKQKQTH